MPIFVGGIAASRPPKIGFAVDRDKRDDPVWAPIFAGKDAASMAWERLASP